MLPRLTRCCHGKDGVDVIRPARARGVGIPRPLDGRTSDPHEEGVEAHHYVDCKDDEPQKPPNFALHQSEQRDGERGFAQGRSENGKGAREVADDAQRRKILGRHGVDMSSKAFGNAYCYQYDGG